MVVMQLGCMTEGRHLLVISTEGRNLVPLPAGFLAVLKMTSVTWNDKP